MPSTPEAPTTRDVGSASNECRINASKNRKENDWFGHDAGSKTPSGAQRLTSSSVGVRTPNKTSQESEQWFRYDANGTKPEAEVTSRAGARAHGDQQNWYKHGPEVPDPPSLENKNKTRSRRSACSEVRVQRATDSNDWFRHDHKNGAFTSGSRRPVKVNSPTSLWVVTTEDGKSPADLASTPRPKSRHTGPEADEYYLRDKTGTSSEWFSHEHPRDDPLASAGSGNIRTRRTPEGCEIANRLKGESEDWFSHDNNRNYVTPVLVVKGKSPLTRDMMERAQGREVKQIFCMEENLRATWIAPPPLLGGSSSQVIPTVPSIATPTSSTASNGTDSTELVQEKMDNLLLSNGQNIVSE